MAKRAAVLVNGQMSHPGQVERLAGQADLLIAADGGSRHALALGLWPDLVVGDLDSLTPEERAELAAHGAELIEYSPRKDETDLELALLQAVERGADEIVILAALGGRTDQTLANILLLALPELAEKRASLVDGVETIYLVRDRLGIAGRPGDVLSLIPIGGDAEDIWTDGLEYALQGDVLYLARARGISNVFQGHQAMVHLGRGMLLAVHRAQELVYDWPT